jgi:hypothetical protein
LLCANDGTEDCRTCDAGFVMSAVAGAGQQTCIANACTCTNGTPTIATGTAGTLCDTNGQEDCSACAGGYHLSDTAPAGTATTCGECTCSNGTPTIAAGTAGTLCETNGHGWAITGR